MNSTLKTIISIIIGVVGIYLAATLFFWMLPFLLIIGLILVVYFILKVKSMKKQVERELNKKSSYNSTYRASENTEYKESAPVDDVVSEVIDVDYKEVN